MANNTVINLTVFTKPHRTEAPFDMDGIDLIEYTSFREILERPENKMSPMIALISDRNKKQTHYHCFAAVGLFRWCVTRNRLLNPATQKKVSKIYCFVLNSNRFEHLFTLTKENRGFMRLYVDAFNPERMAQASYVLADWYYEREAPLDEVRDDDIVDRERVKWLLKAAELGHIDAQHELGACYEAGVYVPQDEKVAFSWYKKSADQGGMKAQAELGLRYQRGLGVEMDLGSSFHYYELAAQQGDDRSRRLSEVVFRLDRAINPIVKRIVQRESVI